MGGHGHGEAPYKIPDYKQFQIKGIPQLEELEKALSQRGLKDPWIRSVSFEDKLYSIKKKQFAHSED